MYGLHLTRTHDLLEQLVNDVFKSFEILENDKESQYLRRVTIRTVFSFIEAIPQIIKYELRKDILIDDYSPNLTIKEKEILNETKMKGNQSINFNPAINDNLKQTFKLAIKIWNITNYQFDTSSELFEKFLSAKNTRNRLTHPKKFHDVKISDHEMSDVAQAFVYCRDSFTSLINAKNKAIIATFTEEDRISIRKTLKLSSKEGNKYKK